jgi:serine/threonine protein kinase
MGACTQPGNLMIVTEYMERGSVYDLLHDKVRPRVLPSRSSDPLTAPPQNIQLSFRLRMKWAKEAALGMNWLHKSNPVFIHRDLKVLLVSLSCISLFL